MLWASQVVSAGKGSAYLQAQTPEEFNSQDPQGDRENQFLSCPLIFTHDVVHPHPK